LNPFEIKLIRFENRIGRTVLPAPPVSAAPTASPRCLALHPAADDRAPVTSRPTCQPPRPASRRPRRPPLSRGNTPPARTAVGPLPRHRDVRHRAQAPPLPLSLPLRLHAAPTLPAPSPPLPFKTELPPADRIFLPLEPFVSPVHSRASHTLPPPPRCPPRRLSAPSFELLHSSIDHHHLTPLASLELQDLSTFIDDHWSYPAAQRRLRRLTIGTPF
jgi:hypothetical protein